MLHPVATTMMIVAAIASMALSACKTQPQPEPGQETATAGKTGPEVATIVFLGQAEACPCTTKRIADSWTALQAALADSKARVDRFDIDVVPEITERYETMKSYVALPAVYLLDKEDKLIEMLQGEISDKKFRKALGR